MNITQRIHQFNRANEPMHIVDHENGEYSLCLPLDFLTEPYRDFGQEAFNQYAEQNGDPVKVNGLYTHGSGYEWETVFKKAFEKDDNLNKISFDCETGGFFCYSEDLSVLESFGEVGVLLLQVLPPVVVVNVVAPNDVSAVLHCVRPSLSAIRNCPNSVKAYQFVRSKRLSLNRPLVSTRPLTSRFRA